MTHSETQEKEVLKKRQNPFAYVGSGKPRPLVIYPDSILTKPTNRTYSDLNSEIENKELLDLIEDMYATMDKHNGVGLAANQIGVTRSIIVYRDPESQLFKYMINPVIMERSTELVEDWEGCLSFPGITVKVSRPKTITVNYADLNDTIYSHCKLSPELSRIIFHEIEHLQGITFLKYLSRLKADLVTRKLTKFKKRKERRIKQIMNYVKKEDK